MPSSKSNVARLPAASALSWDDLRLLVDNVLDYAIFMLDPEGYVATWSAGAEKIQGYRADEIVGRHFSDFYPKADVDSGKPERLRASAIEHGRVEDEGWRVRKDGTRFWASVVITALRDDNGQLRGFGKLTRDLSARRDAEEELRRSEERFRLLIENVADYAIYMLDPEGRVATWNLGAERMKGYGPREVIGRSFAMFFPPEDVDAGKPARELAVARAVGRFEDEGWRMRKDGTRFWATATLTALYDPRGDLLGFAKITRDLTARREAEETQRRLLREQTAREVAESAERRLKESEERYRALSERLEIVIEGVADGITVQERSGRVVFANSAAARLCGFASAAELQSVPPEEVVSRFQLLDEAGQPFKIENLPGRRVLAGEEESSTAVIRVRERAGQRREWWSRVRARAVRDASGAPELAVNIWHDVTIEHRQNQQTKYLADAAAALGSSLDREQMFSKLAQVLVPELADGCSIYLLDGEQLRAVTAEHVDPSASVTAAEYRRRFPPEAAGCLWKVVQSGVPEVFSDLGDEVLARATQDPEALALLSSLRMSAALVVPIRARDRILGALALISAQSQRRFEPGDVALVEELGRRAGAALENAQLFLAAQDAAQRAEEASRAKDEFLATVSHELRTPLTAILGWSALLSARVTDPSIAKPIEVIHRNASAQVKIIDDILDVSRVITGKFRLDPKPVDLAGIAREAIEVVRPSATAKKLTLEFQPGADVFRLVADGDRLRQVIWNLLSNAVKFTEPGGQIRVDLARDGSDVVLSVSDTGIGIAPDFAAHLFQRFRQADSSTTRRVGGLGLGLAIVRHIVELHGGQVTANSEGLGKGATFTMRLPIHEAVASASPGSVARPDTPAASRPEATLRGVRVLVVDDDLDARELIAAVLTEAGATVETVPSADEAFAALGRFHPDVLVSDIGMPGEDGLSLMRRIRALSPSRGGSIPALALTAFAREEDRATTLASGYTAHVGKPVDPSALVAAVAKLGVVSRST